MRRIDPILFLLLGGMAFFTGILIYTAHAFKDDGQIFQVIGSIVTGFVASFFTRVTPKRSDGTQDKNEEK